MYEPNEGLQVINTDLSNKLIWDSKVYKYDNLNYWDTYLFISWGNLPQICITEIERRIKIYEAYF